MAEATVFDILVRSLDSQERKSLLERILASSRVSQVPLRPADEASSVVDLDTEYRRMSLVRRLLILVQSLITGKDRYAVLEQILLRRLEALIEHHGAGLVQFRGRLFGQQMYDALAALRMSVQYLRGPLDLAMRREKEDFVTFLAGVEMPEVQKRLMDATDPGPLSGEADIDSLKTELGRRCDEVLDGIPKDTRRGVYYDVQALAALTRLAMHPFAAMLACFHPGGEGGERACSFAELARYVVALSEVLSAVQFPPTAEALRALFVYNYKENLLDAAFRLDEHLEGDLYSAEGALNGIREFNESVPLDLIVKYATGNLGYQPKAPGGGEDWFVVYKSFWRRRLARNYALFARVRMEQRLAARATAYLGVATLPAAGSLPARAVRRGGRAQACAVPRVPQGILPAGIRPCLAAPADHPDQR